MKHLLIILTAITLTSGGLKITASVKPWVETEIKDNVLYVRTNVIKVVVNPYDK